MPRSAVSSSAEQTQTATLAFNLILAFFPDPYSATQLTRLADSKRAKHGLRGMPIAETRFHVSLHGWGFDGHPPEDFIRNVSDAAEEVAGPVPPFEVTFDRTGSFLGSGAFVLRTDKGNRILRKFREDLGVALQSRGMRRQSTFTPHVTLLYDYNRIIREEVVEPVSWVVNDFKLVSSLVGKSAYSPLGEWKLRG